jgi:hypothetical protein
MICLMQVDWDESYEMQDKGQFLTDSIDEKWRVRRIFPASIFCTGKEMLLIYKEFLCWQSFKTIEGIDEISRLIRVTQPQRNCMVLLVYT